MRRDGVFPEYGFHGVIKNCIKFFLEAIPGRGLCNTAEIGEKVITYCYEDFRITIPPHKNFYF